GKYGLVSIYGIHRSTGAHRVSYELYKGPLIDGMHIHHKCKTPTCINPDHLEQVTRKQNWAMSDSPSAVNARASVCKRGHKLEGGNVYMYRNKRLCRACRKMAEIRYGRTHTTVASRRRTKCP